MNRSTGALGVCDAGIVILSPHYVGKTWTNRELQGFMALEEKTKRIILPVWKDIDRTGVLTFSPIMADRVAARASEGMAAVVAALRTAIDAATRAVDRVSPITSGTRLAELGRDLKAKADAKARLETTPGVEQVKQEAVRLLEILEVSLQGADSPGLKFNTKRQGLSLVTHAGGIMSLKVSFHPRFINTVVDVPLHAALLQRSDPYHLFGDQSAPTMLDELEFTPWFAGEIVVWQSPKKEPVSSEQVVEAVLAMLHRNLTRETSWERLPPRHEAAHSYGPSVLC